VQIIQTLTVIGDIVKDVYQIDFTVHRVYDKAFELMSNAYPRYADVVGSNNKMTSTFAQWYYKSERHPYGVNCTNHIYLTNDSQLTYFRLMLSEMSHKTA